MFGESLANNDILEIIFYRALTYKQRPIIKTESQYTVETIPTQNQLSLNVLNLLAFYEN